MRRGSWPWPGRSPVERISASTSERSAAARAGAAGKRRNRAGVTWLTRASVHWAERIVATSSSKGLRVVERAGGLGVGLLQGVEDAGGPRAPRQRQRGERQTVACRRGARAPSVPPAPGAAVSAGCAGERRGTGSTAAVAWSSRQPHAERADDGAGSSSGSAAARRRRRVARSRVAEVRCSSASPNALRAGPRPSAPAPRSKGARRRRARSARPSIRPSSASGRWSGRGCLLLLDERGWGHLGDGLLAVTVEAVAQPEGQRTSDQRHDPLGVGGAELAEGADPSRCSAARAGAGSVVEHGQRLASARTRPRAAGSSSEQPSRAGPSATRSAPPGARSPGRRPQSRRSRRWMCVPERFGRDDRVAEGSRRTRGRRRPRRRRDARRARLTSSEDRRDVVAHPSVGFEVSGTDHGLGAEPSRPSPWPGPHAPQRCAPRRWRRRRGPRRPSPPTISGRSRRAGMRHGPVRRPRRTGRGRRGGCGGVGGVLHEPTIRRPPARSGPPERDRARRGRQCSGPFGGPYVSWKSW